MTTANKTSELNLRSIVAYGDWVVKNEKCGCSIKKSTNEVLDWTWNMCPLHKQSVIFQLSHY